MSGRKILGGGTGPTGATGATGPAVSVTGSGYVVATSSAINAAAQPALVGLGTAWGAVDGLGTQAMADANQTPSSAVYIYGTITTTGAITANRNLTLPTPAAGQEYTRTIINACTGAFSVVVLTSGGTSVTVPNGTTREVFVTAAGAQESVTGQNSIALGAGIPAAAGLVRCGNVSQDIIAIRNSGNSADITLMACSTGGVLYIGSNTSHGQQCQGMRIESAAGIYLTGVGAANLCSFDGSIIQPYLPMSWANGVSPTVKQDLVSTNSATGAAFTVQAQNATGTTSTGGKLALTSGTGTTVAGNVELQTGGTKRVYLTPTALVFTTMGVPGTPAAGEGALYFDGTNFKYKDAAGTIKTITAV